eukprot:283599_1
MSVHPDLAWAQRPDTVLITVSVQDAKDVDISVTDTLTISCVGGEKKYECKIPLFAEVVPEESSNVVRPRAIEIKLQKKVTTDEYWTRLTKEKVKNAHIQIDWNRWKDEDEAEEGDTGDFGAGGMPGMGGMGGAGGMPGMPGMGGAGGMPGMGGAGGMS